MTPDQALKSKPTLCCTVEDGRIVIRCPYNERLRAVLREEIDARWSKPNRAWNVDATPGAAHRIVSEIAHSPEYSVAVEADDEIYTLAALLRGRFDARDDQPPHRVLDAWSHQRSAYWFAVDRPASMLAMFMGTGKSKVTVDVLVNTNAKLVLVLCPVSVRGVWRRELEKHAPGHFESLILEKGTTKKKAEKASQHIRSAETRRTPLVVVTNYESTRSKVFRDALKSFRWDVVVCDESHRIKSHNSQQSKAAYEIGKHAKQRLCLTGTVMPHSPLDVFGQYRFLDAGIFGTSFHRFRNQFAISGPMGASHIVGFQNQGELARRMAPITFEADKSVLDLPDANHRTIPVSLSRPSMRVYDDLSTHMVAEIERGIISAANGLVKLLRLQQVTSGFVVDDDGAERMLGTEKQQALSDLIDGIREPVVVFCRFRSDLSRVRETAEKMNRTYGELSGSQRDIDSHGCMPEGFDVFGVQIQSGGVGIDLTRSRYAVYWNHPWSLGEYDQSLARLHRPGQERSVFYYHLLGERTVDEVVFPSLDKKRDVVESVIKHLRGSIV